jgi:hypothetical protein
VRCPGCAAATHTLALESRIGRTITVDACTNCGVLWFDDLESPQLSPGSILTLFQLIGDGAATPRPARPTVLRCPRCDRHLLLTHDRQRQTPFDYWRCDAEHGRLITFYNFLREKDFIRPLTLAQLAELRDNLQTVRCSSCGAPIDVTKTSACTHCGTPLSLLDMHQAARLLEDLKQAAAPKPIDPSLPFDLMRAARESEANSTFGGNEDWWKEAGSTGLVEAGLGALARIMKKV